MSASWFKSLRRGCSSIDEVTGSGFDEIVGDIKGAESGITSVDSAMRDLNFTQVGDELMVGTTRWRDVEPLFRKGELDEAFESMNVTTTFSSADKANFKKLAGKETPDIKIDDLDKKVEASKTIHSDLDVTPEVDGDALKNKLDPSSQEKVKSMYDKIKGKVGIAIAASGVFATIIFTADMWSDINTAVKEMNGCFVVSGNTESISCKLLTHTCGYGTEGATACDTVVSGGVSFNVRLMLLDILNRNSTADIEALTTLGVVPTPLDSTNMEEILSTPENIPLLTQYYATLYPDPSAITFSACSLAVLSDDCVACDPTNTTNSIYFTSLSGLESNQTVRCVKDSTVLDMLVDVSTEVGAEIFDAVGDSISGSFSSNFFLAIFLVLIVIGVIIFMIKNKGSKTTSKPSGVPVQQAAPPAYEYTPVRGRESRFIG